MERHTGWPCAGPLLDLAERFARKLLPAFNTETGMPFGTVSISLLKVIDTFILGKFALWRP
jgi:hypothetical protein